MSESVARRLAVMWLEDNMRRARCAAAKARGAHISGPMADEAGRRLADAHDEAAEVYARAAQRAREELL